MAIYVGDCRRCGAKKITFHVFGIAVAKETYEREVEARHVKIIELACQCPNCMSSTLFMLGASGEKPPNSMFPPDENPANCGYTELTSFPAAATETAPEHTPTPAADFYNQAAAALANGLHDAAGCMFRKCLESVTRSEALFSRVPEADREKYRASWLKACISKLKEIHAIPPALGDLVDVIKEEGDAAVHDDIRYHKPSAEALRNFTKTFLEYTFTMPENIRKVRAPS